MCATDYALSRNTERISGTGPSSQLPQFARFRRKRHLPLEPGSQRSQAKWGRFPGGFRPGRPRYRIIRPNLTGSPTGSNGATGPRRAFGQVAADAPCQLAGRVLVSSIFEPSITQLWCSQPSSTEVAEKAQLAPGRGRLERHEDSKNDFQFRRLSIACGTRVRRRRKHGLLVAISFVLRDQNLSSRRW